MKPWLIIFSLCHLGNAETEIGLNLVSYVKLIALQLYFIIGHCFHQTKETDSLVEMLWSIAAYLFPDGGILILICLWGWITRNSKKWSIKFRCFRYIMITVTINSKIFCTAENLGEHNSQNSANLSLLPQVKTDHICILCNMWTQIHF